MSRHINKLKLTIPEEPTEQAISAFLQGLSSAGAYLHRQVAATFVLLAILETTKSEIVLFWIYDKLDINYSTCR
jgi:hypothetical protein